MKKAEDADYVTKSRKIFEREFEQVSSHTHVMTTESHNTVEYKVKARLKLYGDETVSLPYETCYDGAIEEDTQGQLWLTYTKEVKCG